VPIIYEGPWDPERCNPMCEGSTTIRDIDVAKYGNGEGIVRAHEPTHVREGFVVKPIVERWDPEIGRVILKRHGEGYLLRHKG